MRILKLSSLFLAISITTAAAQPFPHQTFLELAPRYNLIKVDTHATFYDELEGIKKDWARFKYQVSGEEAQLKGLENLAQKASVLTQQHPDKAEGYLWHATILSTRASIVNGMSALGDVKDAKKLFERSIEIDPKAEGAQAYAILGALYSRVPGWPIAFGSDKKAKSMLEAALKINPEGIDPNFFYAEFLKEQGDIAAAKKYYNRALNAPARPGRELADTGRKNEARAALNSLADRQETPQRRQLNR